MIHRCCGTLTSQASLVGDAQSYGWFPEDCDALAQVTRERLAWAPCWSRLAEVGQRAGYKHSSPRMDFLEDLRSLSEVSMTV